MFRNIAPFAGGCSLEAAEWMEGEGSGESNLYSVQTERGVLELLASLVEKSLVRQMETGEVEPRFQMLETIRQYGLHLLDSLGETTAVRTRQLDYFLALAMRAEPMLTAFQHVADTGGRGDGAPWTGSCLGLVLPLGRGALQAGAQTAPTRVR